MDKFIDTVLRQKPLVKVLILAAVLVVMVGIYWQFFFRPVQEEIHAVEPELNQLKAELAAKREIVKEKGRYIAELERTREKLYVALKQLPDKSEIPTLLENVSSLGTASGLQFKLFMPIAGGREELLRGVPGGHRGRRQVPRRRDLLRQRLQRLPRIVNIVNITMDKPRKDPSGGILVRRPAMRSRTNSSNPPPMQAPTRKTTRKTKTRRGERTMKRSLSFLLTVSLILSMHPVRAGPEPRHARTQARASGGQGRVGQTGPGGGLGEEPKIPEYQVTGVRDPSSPLPASGRRGPR